MSGITFDSLTQILGRSQSIVFIEQCPDIGVVVLHAPRSDHSDTSSRHIPESNVESTELGPNDKEHAKWLLGVLDLGQEVGGEAERECNLGRLVEIGLEDMPERSK